MIVSHTSKTDGVKNTQFGLHILLLNTLHFFNDGYMAALPLFLPFITQDVHLSLRSVGFLGTMLNFSGIILALPAGVLALRFGSVRILKYAVLVYAFAFLLISQASSLVLLFVSFGVASLGFGIFHPIGFSSIAKKVQTSGKKSSLGKEMGAFAAVGDIGRIALASTVTFFIYKLTWNKTALLYCGFALLLFLVLYLFPVKDNSAVGETQQKKSVDKRIFKNKRFLLVNCCSVLDAFASSSFFIFLPFLLVFRNIDIALLGTFTGAFFVGNFLGKTIFGVIIDKIGNIKTFVISELCMALFVVVLALVNNFALIMGLAVIIGMLTKGTVPVTNAMIAESVSREGYFESAYSISSFTVSIANTIAPLFLGFLADAAGIQAVFFCCAACALCAIIPLFFLKHRI